MAIWEESLELLYGPGLRWGRGLTFHHIRHAAVGIDAANVFGVGWVGAAVKDECCGQREGRCRLLHSPPSS